MRKLINHPSNAATESLQGFELAYGHLLQVHYAPDFVYRKDAPVQGKVAIISGSGSGHEPLNSGYVGMGMLDASCPGAIFTSPAPPQYLAAAQAVHGGVGIFFVVKNYTGGVLNTEIAMEMLADEGIAVASVLVHDDVAVERTTNRRGTGATVFVEKIAGAAAEQGRSLAEIAALAQRTSEQSRSMGVALTSCTAPNIGHPTFQLPEGQIELGVGIHGEPGRRRALLARSDDIVDMLLTPIMHDLRLRADDRVLVLVSGLGGTPQHELFIVYRHLHYLLEQNSIHVERQLVGNYITSLDMAGCIVSVLRLDPELLSLWDAPVNTPALRW
ncbi:MAG: dihydroxyacetone kinase subunit DhaK [Caldilineaceae bacterium]|nr:dihydroxyacetone kinase subunit DhaK [Caldilineaceae bacterium]